MDSICSFLEIFHYADNSVCCTRTQGKLIFHRRAPFPEINITGKFVYSFCFAGFFDTKFHRKRRNNRMFIRVISHIRKRRQPPRGKRFTGLIALHKFPLSIYCGKYFHNTTFLLNLNMFRSFNNHTC